jgi:RNA polymerase sigma-70 factor (sigma-E family)
MSEPLSEVEFAEFVHSVWPSLYRTAYLLIGEHSEAEDLVQTALAKTYAAWGRVRTLEAAPAYSRAVLVNTATSWFRRRSWRNERPTELLPESSYEVDPSQRPSLSAVLSQLPPRQRAVVVLRFYNDLSVSETADLLGCAEGTVKSQTSAALTRLRQLLGDSVVPETMGANHE